MMREVGYGKAGPGATTKDMPGAECPTDIHHLLWNRSS